MKKAEPILEVNNLAISFETDRGKIHAVRNLSLSVGQGEIFAVVGESGCGKSVLAKAIMGLLPANAIIESGQITLAKKQVRPAESADNPPLPLLRLSDAEYCKVRGEDISIVFQDPMTSLDPTYTIGEQIAEALAARDFADKAERRRRVIELMESVGITEAELRYDVYPQHLSGGMRQRCVIAMSLARNPDILIADEPTTSIDVTVQAKIIKLLKEIVERTGMSILFITHDLSVVGEIADRVAIMYAGKIIEQGLTYEIFDGPVHPYTLGLFHALPAYAYDGHLHPIAGQPPIVTDELVGDAFAVRNPFALGIDYVKEPPFFELSKTHTAATWLLDDRAPAVDYGAHHHHTDELISGETQVRPAHAGEVVLAVSGLSHYFKIDKKTHVAAVKDASLDVRRGEIVALVGESGSGKSTLAKCVMGILKPSEGAIDRKYQKISMIMQDSTSALNGKMRVRDIVAEPLEIVGGKSRAEIDALVAGALADVAIDAAYMDRHPAELSGGQRQRVAIARAIVTEPDVIIADEPLASLDVSIQAQIVELFSKIVQEREIAMLFISHDLSMVRFISSRTAVMYRGKIVEFKDTVGIFSAPQDAYTRELIASIPDPVLKRPEHTHTHTHTNTHSHSHEEELAHE